MSGVSSQKRRFVALRNRVLVWIAVAILSVLPIALLVDGPGGSVEAILIPVMFICPVALTLRTFLGFDATIDDHQLVYRAAWRSYSIPRTQISSARVEDGQSSAGLNNLMTVKLHLNHEVDFPLNHGAIFPLKLFNCFRPTPEVSEPIGYRRMCEMADEITEWANAASSHLASRQLPS